MNQKIIITYIVLLMMNTIIFSQSKNVTAINNDTTLLGDSVKTSIGVVIINGSERRLAKSYDRLRKGEKFQIYLNSYSNGYLYILNNADNDEYTIVASGKLRSDSSYIYPSQNKFYEIDGKQIKETISVIISKSMLKQNDLKGLYSQIKTTKNAIISENISFISKVIGNLRSSNDLNNMKIYMGKEFIFKEYKFDVKK